MILVKSSTLQAPQKGYIHTAHTENKHTDRSLVTMICRKGLIKTLNMNSYWLFENPETLLWNSHETSLETVQEDDWKLMLISVFTHHIYYPTVFSLTLSFSCILSPYTGYTQLQNTIHYFTANFLLLLLIL